MARLAVRLLPECVVGVLLFGRFRGWLIPMAAHSRRGAGSRLSCTPSSEWAPGGLGADSARLSLPSMLMVRGAFPDRVIVALGYTVMGMGMVAALVMTGLT